MTNWKVKIKGIRELLTDDSSDENAIKIGVEIYKILTSTQYKKYFKDFEDLDEFIFIRDLNHFNNILDKMYDYTDENLIWIDFD